jgi:hypothetical protein
VSDFPPRSWSRSIWRWYWRQSRIAARESTKTMQDLIIYGAGFCRIDADGVTHVPYADIMNERSKEVTSGR